MAGALNLTLAITILVASQEGFEPPADGLEVRCSIQLSYWDIKTYNHMERVMGIEPTRLAWKARALPLSYTRVFVRCYFNI
jgi:hypothetical protein